MEEDRIELGLKQQQHRGQRKGKCHIHYVFKIFLNYFPLKIYCVTYEASVYFSIIYWKYSSILVK